MKLDEYDIQIYISRGRVPEGFDINPFDHRKLALNLLNHQKS